MCNSNTLTCRDTRQASTNACSCPTGWRRPTGCLILTGHFQQKISLITESFAERDLQPKASYASSPICIPNVWSDILRQYVICLQKKKSRDTFVCTIIQMYMYLYVYTRWPLEKRDRRRASLALVLHQMSDQTLHRILCTTKTKSTFMFLSVGWLCVCACVFVCVCVFECSSVWMNIHTEFHLFACIGALAIFFVVKIDTCRQILRQYVICLQK